MRRNMVVAQEPLEDAGSLWLQAFPAATMHRDVFVIEQVGNTVPYSRHIVCIWKAEHRPCSPGRVANGSDAEEQQDKHPSGDLRLVLTTIAKQTRVGLSRWTSAKLRDFHAKKTSQVPYQI